MLQQTQVATVIDYYHRFLAAYPDVHSLAAADEQSVLRLWAGLGYYRRARQLHAAAKQMVAAGGDFPKSLAEITSLPGIGRYTAGAIASFAYDQPTPIVEANTQRLFSRLIRLEIDPRSRDGQSQLWDFAESLVRQPSNIPSFSPGRINQAVMELGSQICTPRNPDCPNCPLSRLCPTFAAGLQTILPIAAPKKVITELTHVAIVVRDVRGSDRFLMRQNSEDQWWHGLWDFPRLDVSHLAAFSRGRIAPQPRGASKKKATQKQPDSSKPLANFGFAPDELDWLAAELHSQHKINCTLTGYHSSWKHAVTRYRISLHAFTATTTASDPRKLPPSNAWHSISQAQEQPHSAPAKRLLTALQSSS